MLDVEGPERRAARRRPRGCACGSSRSAAAASGARSRCPCRAGCRAAPRELTLSGARHRRRGPASRSTSPRCSSARSELDVAGPRTVQALREDVGGIGRYDGVRARFAPTEDDGGRDAAKAERDRAPAARGLPRPGAAPQRQRPAARARALSSRRRRVLSRGGSRSRAAAGRAGSGAGASAGSAGLLGAERLVQLAGLEHLGDDVAAADQLAVDEELRDRRPLRDRGQLLADARVGQDVDRGERLADRLEGAPPCAR